MSEQCRYVAIDGSVIDFGIDGKLFMGQGDLRSYSWNANAPYGYISSFAKDDIITKSNTIYIRGTKQEVKNTANEIFNIFEKDIEYKNNHPESEKTGRLYIGDCYLRCFVVSSAPSCYLTHKRFLKKSISIVTDSPEWIKEKQYSFSNINKHISTKKYPYKYPYVYYSAVGSEALTNNFTQSTDFEFVIESADGHNIINPYVIIGAQRYQFFITVLEGEKLIVNSLAQTIVKIDSFGNVENVLYARNKAYDVFAKIPIGVHSVSVSENSKVIMTLLQKRSAPEWN